MSVSRPAGAEALELPSLEAVGAVASFLRDHPERIRAVASGLKGSERCLESVVGGSSMGRQLPDGAPIRIQLSGREIYQPGEIVAFLTGTRVGVHRVLFCGRAGRRRGVVLTRGDAYLCPDLPFHVSSVLGAVVAVRTERGWQPPDAPVRRPPGERALAGCWRSLAVALCFLDLGLARRALGWLYFAGRTAKRRFRRAR